MELEHDVLLFCQRPQEIRSAYGLFLLRQASGFRVQLTQDRSKALRFQKLRRKAEEALTPPVVIVFQQTV